MTAPSFKSKGTFASGTGNVTPGLPTGVSAGDLMLLFVHSANQAASAPSGWTAIPAVSGNPFRGTAGSAGGVRLDIFYRFWQSGDAAPTVTDTGNLTVAIILAYAGVDPTTPFDGVQPIAYNAAASTTLTLYGITTATDNALVVMAAARDVDATSSNGVTGALTNSNLTFKAEHHDQTVNTATGGGLAVFSGVLATAGATGDSTATQTSSAWGGITLSLRPAAESSTAVVFITEESFTTTSDASTHSITVPADADCVVVMCSGWDNDDLFPATMDINGNAITAEQYYIEDDRQKSSIGYLVGPPTGSQTLTWDFVGSGAISEGMIVTLAYFKRVDQSDPIISSNKSTNTTDVTLSGTITSDDMMVGMTTQFNETPLVVVTGSGQIPFFQQPTFNNTIQYGAYKLGASTYDISGGGSFTFTNAALVLRAATGDTDATGTAATTGVAQVSAASGAAKVTGTGATTAAAQTSAASGAATVEGSAATAAPAQTTAASGEATDSGTAATSAPAQTTAASGEAIVQGSAATSAPPPYASATGTVPAEGSAATSAPAQTTSATAIALTEGALAVTAPAQVSDADGVVTVEGSAATTAPAQTSSAAGLVPIGGEAATTAPAQTSSASGTLTVEGSAATSAPAQSSDAAGDVAPGGSASTSAPAQTTSASGIATVEGAAASTAPAQTSAAAGTLTVEGAAASTAPAQTSAAAGGSPVEGEAATSAPAQVSAASGDAGQGVASTLAPAQTSAATGVATVEGAAATSAPAQTSAASGNAEWTGTAATTAPAQTSAASGELTVEGSAATSAPAQMAAAIAIAASLGDASTTAPAQTSSAAGELTVEGSASTTAPAQVSDGTIVFNARGSVATAALAQTSSASGTVEQPDATIYTELNATAELVTSMQAEVNPPLMLSATARLVESLNAEADVITIMSALADDVITELSASTE